jgi:adenylate cyclase class IV
MQSNVRIVRAWTLISAIVRNAAKGSHQIRTATRRQGRGALFSQWNGEVDPERICERHRPLNDEIILPPIAPPTVRPHSRRTPDAETVRPLASNRKIYQAYCRATHRSCATASQSEMNAAAQPSTEGKAEARKGPGMEVEVKLRLPDSAAYATLSQTLIPCFKQAHEQQNYFFTNDAMSAGRAVLRVRFFDGDKKAVITVKGKQVIEGGVGRASEEEEDVDPVLARSFLDNPQALAELDVPVMAKLREQFDIANGSLKPLGGFHNLRKVYRWRGFTLELDQTMYPWGTVHELECETEHPESLRESLEEYLKEIKVPYTYATKSKFANFIDKTLV